jgi:hypothetical protein
MLISLVLSAVSCGGIDPVVTSAARLSGKNPHPVVLANVKALALFVAMLSMSFAITKQTQTLTGIALYPVSPLVGLAILALTAAQTTRLQGTFAKKSET